MRFPLEPEFTIQDGDELWVDNWINFYDSAVTFEYEGATYLFAQKNGRSNRWFISEIDESGVKKEELSSGNWNYFYESIVSFKRDGKPYLFAHSKGRKGWFISELKPRGFSGDEISHERNDWNYFYESVVSFERDGKPYLFAHSKDRKGWFISELDPHSAATVEHEISNYDDWVYFYETVFAFNLNGKPYLFAHSEDRKGWFVSELDPHAESTVNREIVNKTWSRFYKTAAPFYLMEEPYLFAQSKTDKRCFVEKLGEVKIAAGEEVATGLFDKPSDFVRTKGAVVYYEEADKNGGLPAILFNNGMIVQIEKA